VEAALTNLIAQPALFEAAVRCIHERYLDRLERGLAAAAGHCDICWLGDDFASQESLFLSPEHWRRFIKPGLAEQVALARQHGLPVLYHSCGAVRPVLGDLIDIGIHGLLVFQTRAAGMDPESIARDFGGRLVFYGGIDVQQLLSFGSPSEVEAEVQRNLRAFRHCGGYVVANSHHCVATIDGANVEAMCRAARNAQEEGRPVLQKEAT
jgi:uroporphyrinogen decarboxylase